MRERVGSALNAGLWQDLSLLEWGWGSMLEQRQIFKEMNGVMNLPVGILRQIWLWCCTAPRDDGYGEVEKLLPLRIEVPWVTLSAQESGRVRPVPLSSQAREKVTTVSGWVSHRATCVHHEDRTGTGQGAVHLLCRNSILSSCGSQRCHAVSPAFVPCAHPVLGFVPKPSLHAHFHTAFLSRAAGCAAPGMRVLDSAPAARNCKASVLSPVLVKLINPLCSLGK